MTFGPHGYPAPPDRVRRPASVLPLDGAVVAAGLLALIFSFLPYYTTHLSGSYLGGLVSQSGHENAWHGFFGWVSVLLAVAASIATLIVAVTPNAAPTLVPPRLTIASGYILAMTFTVAAAFVSPYPDVSGIPSTLMLHFGRGPGYWADLVVIVIGSVLASLGAVRSGERHRRMVAPSGDPTAPWPPPPPGYVDEPIGDPVAIEYGSAAYPWPDQPPPHDIWRAPDVWR